MNRHLADIIRALLALLLISAGAVAHAAVTCTAGGGTVIDISASGACDGSGERAWVNDADSDGRYDETVCCCPKSSDCDVAYSSSDTTKNVTGYTATQNITSSNVINSSDYDCDETSATVYTGATETTGDEIDQDCDGDEVCYANADGDSYRSSTTKSSTDSDCDDSGEAASSVSSGDCDDSDADTFPGSAEKESTTSCMNDDDGDGYGDESVSTGVTAGTDCNDSSSSINPGATETTGDEIDSDCDDKETCYANADNDSYRTTTTRTSSDSDCDDSGEAASSVSSGDCDDSDSDTFPGAAETESTTACMNDDDADGYGDETVSSGVTAGTDCDDTDATVSPGDSETTGDEKDSNCDDKEVCYVNSDGDAYRASTTVTSSDSDCDDSGEAASSVSSGDCDDADVDTFPGSAEKESTTSCRNDDDGDGYGDDTVGSGVTAGTDCEDADSSINPGATETAGDEIDQTCNGREVCYIDTDGDGYRRDSSYSTTTTNSSDEDCNDSGEAVSTAPATDCDDLDADVNPSETEVAGDNEDTDCDDTELCYYDADNDSYRLSTTFTSSDTDCNDSGEALATDSTGDCDDTSSSINPGKSETTGDNIDQNCDDQEVCYVDADDDTYRITSTVTSSDTDCDDSGEALSSDTSGDCDDADDSVNPGATETANGVDDDCDGTTDNGTTARDLDGDCYCSNETICSSSVNKDCTTYGTSDCDDDDETVYPDAEETNNGVDDDCDGTVDNGTKVYDDDGDCYCDDTADSCTGSVDAACTDPQPLDCNDRRDDVSPDVTDTWYDGYDDDCSGNSDYDQDYDGFVPDDYDGLETTVRGKTTVVDAATLDAGDCDDEDATINPDASEIWYDGIDEDCDALSDFDQDYDLYVDDAYATAETIDPGTGEVIDDGDLTGTGDCDDEDEDVNPGVDEIWYDSYDQNCDSASDYDQDGDGYVEDDYADALTVSPGDGSTVEDGSTTESGECDDEDSTVNPSVSEIWYDGYDQNCDEYTDYDQDGDGYVPTIYESLVTTNPGDGQVVEPGAFPSDDCDDEDAEVNPSVDENWYDGIDQNCDEKNDYDQDEDGAVADEYFGSATYDPGTGDTVDDGSSVIGGECDDEDPDVGPGNGETWYNGIDDDCQQDDDYDQDGDGYVDTSNVGKLTYDTHGAVISGSGALDGDDCDDTDETVNPLVDEIWYDGLDQNCDEYSDYDQDGDGFIEAEYAGLPTYYPADCELKNGEPKAGTDCELVEDGETLATGDCVDSYDALEEQYGYDESSGYDPADIRPYVDEDCEATDTQIDDDCNGDLNTQTDEEGETTYAVNGSGDVYYADADGDLFGDATGEGLFLCFVPDEGYSSTYGDCDDSNANRYPGAAEVCNAIDDNCDLQVDEASNLPENTGGDEASGCVYLYSDRDKDGYGSTDPDDKLCMCTDRKSDECGDGVEYNPEDEQCYTQDSSDCYDRDSTIKPRAEGEELIEYVDGDDNDCDGYVPLVELDCDDDGSLPLLPTNVSSSAEIRLASELGLADCRGGDGEIEPDCCLNHTCPDRSVCDDLVSIDQTVTCWSGTEMRVTCDAETGLIVVSRDYDDEATHFDGGKRVWASQLCETDGDCDDLCPARCPDQEEVCDGMDNDCNGADAFIGDADRDGVPDSIDEDGVPNAHGDEGVVPGYVNVGELDLDGDGYLGCTTDDLVERSQTVLSYEGCSTSENLGDCSDTCYLSSPISEEERCNGFLDVCEGEKEGTDGDRDNFATCGAWGPEDGELGEDLYLLVYLPGLNQEIGETGSPETGTPETGTPETGTPETGTPETGSTDTGSTETGSTDTSTTDTSTTDTGSSHTGSTDTGSSHTGSTDTGATDTGSATDTSATDTSATDTSATDTADTGASPRPRAPKGRPWPRGRAMSPSELDVGVIPMVLPRELAPECDAFLANRLSVVLGEQGLQDAVQAGSTQSMLELCMKAEACRAMREDGLDVSWPSSCEGVTGSCTVVQLTLDTDADQDFYDAEVQDNLDVEASCSDHPEQAVTRTVWTRDRILQARELVVQWECFRLDGTYGCGDLTAPADFVTPYPDGTLEQGNFRNADPDDLLSRDKRWWKELTRYSPEAMLEGVFAGCWGEPEPGSKALAEVISEDVGGDCSDSENLSNRGKVEGPDDLLGLYLDPEAPGDCSLCLDGIDNNCNGLVDCAEPACARCFVGQGTGCGGGSESPCSQGGCSTGSPRRGVDPSGLALVGVALVSLGYRWRRRR